MEGGLGIGLHGDDLGARTGGTSRDCAASHHTSTAHRGKELIDGAGILEQLECEGSLAGGDVQVIVGLDGDEAALGCDQSRAIATLIGVSIAGIQSVPAESREGLEGLDPVGT